jgi:hypothetical protein
VLLADFRVAFELINHARYQVLTRILGVPREQANLATAVIALMMAEAVQTRYRSLMAAADEPTLMDGVIGAAALRELLSEITGLPPEETPVLGTVLAVATVASISRPTLRRSARATRSFSRRMDAAFRRRYGYLVDPGNLRESRARRRAERR